MGIHDYMISQYQQYVLEYKRGAFAVNAPTDVVRTITGREPEDFETITRRYAANMPDAKRSFGTLLKYMVMMNVWMLRPGPRTARHLRKGDFSNEKHVTLSANSPEWLQSHDLQTKSVRARA